MLRIEINRLIVVACLVVTTCGSVFASAAHAPLHVHADDPDFALWLVRVAHHHRGDRTADDQERLNELQARIDAADTPAAKRGLDRDYEKAEAAADKNRTHMIYGWSMLADDAGATVTKTTSMSGFILAPSDENTRAITEMQKAIDRDQPAVLAIKRTGAHKAFTFAGRGWHLATRSAFVKQPPNIMMPGKFPIPPKKASTDQQRNSVKVTLSHVRNEVRESGSTLHRYSLKIDGHTPPANAGSLSLWIAAHLDVDGRRIGPILDHVDVARSSNGTFGRTQSFEFIALKGVTIEPDATTVEPLAVVWE